MTGPRTMPSTRRDFWINQLFFQASWPACVIGAAHGLLWPGFALVGLFAAWQLRSSRRHRTDFRVVAAFALTGVILDTVWVRTGLVDYAADWPVTGMAPAWLVLLWIALGLTANHSLAMFRGQWRLFALLASIGSPLSYAAAARLGAVEWLAPAPVVLLCLGPLWALVAGGLFALAGSLERTVPADSLVSEAARG